MRTRERLRREIHEGIRKRMRMVMVCCPEDEIGWRIKAAIDAYLLGMVRATDGRKRVTNFGCVHVERTETGFRVRFRTAIEGE